MDWKHRASGREEARGKQHWLRVREKCIWVDYTYAFVCVSCISIRKFSPRAFILVFSSYWLQSFCKCVRAVCSGYAVNRNAAFRLWNEKEREPTQMEKRKRAWHYTITTYSYAQHTAFVRVNKQEEKMYSTHKHMGNTGHPYMRTTNVLGKLLCVWQRLHSDTSIWVWIVEKPAIMCQTNTSTAKLVYTLTHAHEQTRKQIRFVISRVCWCHELPRKREKAVPLKSTGHKSYRMIW